jgi:hypothetical protein
VAGNSVVTTNLQASITDRWRLEALIIRTSSSAFNSTSQALTNGTTAKVVNSTLGSAATWSGAITVQFSCTQTSARDVTQDGMLIEYGKQA